MHNMTLPLAGCLLARTGVAGVMLFMLPPIGEFPPPWQIEMAFLAWIAWCYSFGLFGRSRIFLAAAESAVSLWLSLKWTRLLILAASSIF
jgi:hypothetical protein